MPQPERTVDPLRPFVFEKDASERGDLAATITVGIAVVEFAGGEYRLLPSKECLIAGDYGQGGFSPNVDSFELWSEDSVKAWFPAGFARLMPELQRSRFVRVSYWLRAHLEARPAGLTDNLQSSACQRATHYVQSMQSGAFVVETHKATRSEATVSVGPIGGKWKRALEVKRFRSGGDWEKCSDDKLAAEWCNTPVRLTMAPIAELQSTPNPPVPPPAKGDVTEQTPATVPLVVPPGMVLFSGGDFQLGCATGDIECAANEKRRQNVLLDPYFLDEHEVTVVEYGTCVDAGRCSFPEKLAESPDCNWNQSDRQNHPMNCVTHAQARSFCEWKGRRLPKEAEWERAARYDGRGIYPWGNTKPDCTLAVFALEKAGCGTDATWPVCSKTDGNSPEGLCDLAGNVEEWTEDMYDNSGDERSVKGGSWMVDGYQLRATYRGHQFPGSFGAQRGFRCAKDADV